MSSGIEEIIEKLRNVLGEKKECNKGICRLDKKNVEGIFSPDVWIDKGLLELLKEKQLLAFNENPNICDCIVVCKDGKIFVVEILCGKLTLKELKSKGKQVANGFFIVKHLGLRPERAYIVYLRKDIKKSDEGVFNKHLRLFQRQKPPIFVKCLDELKDKKKKEARAFLICGGE